MSEIRAAVEMVDKAMTLADKTLGSWFTRRRADADAYTTVTSALATVTAELIDSDPLDPMMMEALISCGGKTNLKNLAYIVSKASRQLTDAARPDEISDDWAANFKDKARTCSDRDMAELWAQILAGEANKPGSCSRKAVNTLGDMDKTDAESFSDLCRFQLILGASGRRIPVLIDQLRDVYRRLGITNNSLGILREFGLVSYFGDPFGGVSLGLTAKCNVVGHSQGMLYFARRDGSDEALELDVGSVQFTRTGAEMSNLCLPLRNPPEFVDGLARELEKTHPDFDIRRYPTTVHFGDGVFRVRPDLGTITGPHTPED